MTHTLLLVCLALASDDAGAERFAMELRDRGLRQLFDRYLEQQSSRVDASVDDRAAMEEQRILALAESASSRADASARAREWEQCFASLDRSTTTATAPRLAARRDLLRAGLRTRWALSELAWRQTHPTDPDPLPLLRGAIAALRTVAGASQNTGGHDADSTTERQVEATELLTVAELALAEALPRGEPERDQLTSAVLARVSANPGLARSDLWKARAYRLRGEWGKADDSLRIGEAADDRHDRESFTDERAHWWLDQNRPADAARELEQSLRARPADPGRRLSLAMDAWLRVALANEGAVEKAREAESAALRLFTRLETAGPSYWLIKGESLLARYATRRSPAALVDLVTSGQALLRVGKPAEAAALLTRAAQAGQADSAGLLFQAGSAWEQAGRWREAAEVFADLPKRWPDHPMAGFSLVRAAQAWRRAGGPQANSRAESALVEHQRRFATDPSRGDAEFLEGQIHFEHRRYPESIESFGAVPVEHRLRGAALAGASRSWGHWLESSDAAGKEADLDRAIAWHDAALSPGATVPFTPAERGELWIRWARLLLDERARRADRAIETLRRFLAAPEPTHGDSLEAKRLLLLAQIDVDPQAAVEGARLAAASLPAPELIALIAELEATASSGGEDRRQRVAAVERPIAKALEQGKAAWPSERIADAELALARADITDGSEQALSRADRRLSQLGTKRPRDARVIEARALLASRRGRHESAAHFARRLVEGTAAGSPTWFRAQLLLVKSLRRAGQFDDAKKCYELLEILRPSLGGPLMKSRFLREKAALDTSER